MSVQLIALPVTKNIVTKKNVLICIAG